jgi:hypothetical protein
MMPDSTRPTGQPDGQTQRSVERPLRRHQRVQHLEQDVPEYLLRFEDLSIMLWPTNPEIGTNLYMRVIPPWIAS